MTTLLATSSETTLDLSLLAVLAALALFLIIAYHSRIPYPILLVVGGAVIGFLPGMPDVQLNPDLVLVIVLPPLLYAAAFFSSLRDLRDNLGQISMLAVGAVIATMVAVAVVAHAVVDGMSWEAAFVLGAVVSPTDAVAATAIASRVGAPSRFVTIIEGESLVNDSTALVAYKFAVAAAVSGSFSLATASGRFVLNAIVGIAIGIAIGWIVAQVRKVIDDAPTEITISLVTPYFAYLPAEALGVSAVLAAVTTGIFLGWRSPQLITPATRIQAFSVWEIVVFVLNAALFMLVGLQLPSVMDGIADIATKSVVVYALAVAATVIGVRFLCVYSNEYLPRFLSRRLRERDPYPPWWLPAIVAWTGIRGAVSLAAALAIPTTIDAGGPFPQRDLIIFLTYAVIAATLLLQGTTLPLIIKALGVEEDGTETQRESKARLLAAHAAIARIDELLEEDWVREDTAERVRGSFEFRIRRFSARFDDADDGAIDARSQDYQRLLRELLEAQRAEIIRLRNVGKINDEIMHRIERDLDLEDTRLEV
ncbi:MAG TPA: Na+/H+ antiporter [Solirubrobacteraceae bacterium]|jgi:CPA1 family monovalent cation:H+ antiporter